jgi:hypothetical protein
MLPESDKSAMPDRALEDWEVLKAEYTHISGAPADGWSEVDKAKDDEEKLRKVLDVFHQKPIAALCLSGGGIRSATFALGVLQRLAKRFSADPPPIGDSLLKQFHYLSTVSGGGFIGSQ